MFFTCLAMFPTRDGLIAAFLEHEQTQQEIFRSVLTKLVGKVSILSAAALAISTLAGQAATVGIFGSSGGGSGYASVLNANGHTASNIDSSQANDASFLSTLDAVILGRTDGTSAIIDFVTAGGLLITEWRGAEWVFNSSGLLDGDAQIGSSPSTYRGTNTTVSFTQAGIDAGLSTGLGSSFADGGATEYFFPVSNLGPHVEILATYDHGGAFDIPTIVGGASGAGSVLMATHDWNDRSYNAADGLTGNEQLLVNMVGYSASVAPVPMPAGLPLMLAGIGFLACAKRARRT